MPDYDLPVQRMGGGMRPGFPGGMRPGFPGGRPGFPGGMRPGFPFRRFPRRFFPFFPIFIGPTFPECFFIDRFGRCCDRFGRCCDRFGRCTFGSDFDFDYPVTAGMYEDDMDDDYFV